MGLEPGLVGKGTLRAGRHRRFRKSTGQHFRHLPRKDRVSMLARLAGPAVTKHDGLRRFKQQTVDSLGSGGEKVQDHVTVRVRI